MRILITNSFISNMPFVDGSYPDSTLCPPNNLLPDLIRFDVDFETGPFTVMQICRGDLSDNLFQMNPDLDAKFV